LTGGLTAEVRAQLKAAPAAAGVVLSWTAPGDDGNTGTAASYDLRYARVPITAANWNDWGVMTACLNEPAPLAAGTVQSYTIDSLDPSTTYYFAIKAADEAGNWSALSNVVSYATPAEDVPPAVITDLRVAAVGQTSVTLGWTAPGDDGTTGTAASYTVKFSTSPITNANWAAATTVPGVPAPHAAGTAESLTVTGLTPGVTYYFAIKTSDEVPNTSGLSNVVSGTPTGDQTAPAAITDLDAS